MMIQIPRVCRLGATGLLCGGLEPAAVQTPALDFLKNVSFQFNGVYQRAGYAFDESLRFVAYDELARFDGRHVRKPGAW